MSSRGDVVDAGGQQLRLTSVLSGGLPATLGTPGAPTLYTVPAVFSRQVSAAERLAIQAPETVRRLADAGYPRVTLDVADRRLLIGSTNLDQLRDGLAHELAEPYRGSVVDAGEGRGEQQQPPLACGHRLHERRDGREVDPHGVGPVRPRGLAPDPRVLSAREPGADQQLGRGLQREEPAGPRP